jgi:putative nucleotidyltransferase with HDIG domain
MIYEDRINKILNHKKYKEYINKIEFHEKEREFCRHNLQHFIDASRIAYILNLEKRLNINKELIYAVGLLHDIGRWAQYETGIEHNIASAELCEEILVDCNFNNEEINEIKKSILNHRKNENEYEDLASIFYSADKLSRNCFSCKCLEKCNWYEDKKNLFIKY